MADFAIIENSKVINIVLAEASSDVPLTEIQTVVEIAAGDALIGWGYDGTKFIDPTPTE